MQAERDLDRIKIEKLQAITQAEAIAESTKIQADAIAYKKRVEAEAEAYSLQVIREELSKSNQLIQYKGIEQWDGVLPKFSTGVLPFVDITTYDN